MQTCINLLVQIYTSAYFDMGLFTKALEITWAKPMYMKYIFLCEGGMHLLITGFASIGYLHGKARLGELSFEFEFVCSLWLWYFLVILAYFFDFTAVDSVKHKLSWKECDKALLALSWVSYHALPLPHSAVGVIVAFPGRTHLLFKLTFSIQFLKVELQQQQNFLWWCPVSFAWVLRGILTINQTQKWTDNCN